MGSQKVAEVSCSSCKNFYITWEKEFPYGCRAMDFKSIRLPSLDVVEADGQECLAHENRVSKAKKGSVERITANGSKASKLNIQV
ncbi:hypothetical protein N9D99_00595 [Gammaproteobacteria bacterium]|nr:hypothetical protein [Gammaproteobacteria bacterium]MDB2443611.1 hypothetical protein [Gammaproteobacteria bacterium]